jgi:soluble lytic murein transglycosylase-like protein
VGGKARAHAAAALAQIGRFDEARQEVRAGLALARNSEERSGWTALAAEMGAVSGAIAPRYQALGDFQTPALEPNSGFTVDKALVYAIVRQESGFNPRAMSPVGAIGLMQVMPASAALAERDESFKRKVSLLMEPGMNLRVGQDYLAYLMGRGVGTDLLRVVAAYNAGPGAVLNTIAKVGDKDPLLLIESLPALETRNYVEKVVQAYWTYKKIFGEATPTLDAAASGAQLIDVRYDLANPAAAQTDAATQAANILGVDRSSALD